MTSAVSITFKIEKADKTGRYVAGWLSVVEKDGKVVEDTQGDRMSMETLRKGVHEYMRGSRVIKKQHSGDQIGEMSEVIMIDDDFAKAHGITHGKRGAWGLAEITDPEVQKSVARGDVTGWSMGGKGKRTPIAKASKTFRGQRVSSAERRSMATRTLPKLRRHEGSWIATAPGGGAREFFTRGNAQRALNAGWKVKTAGAHLGSLSRRSKVRKARGFFARFL